MLTPELRGRVEAAIEALIGLLDALDGDCEDEGAQCEDEGFDSDREPEDFHAVPEYADGGMNQLRIASHYGPGIAVSELGVR